MEIKKIQGAIEAILFSSGDPVGIDKISDTLNLDKPTVSKILKNLMDKFNVESSGIQILKLDDSYQMCSSSQYGEYVKKILDIRRNTPLSQASMEVLAIIAYNQPVTKAFIEQIRGVDCSGVLGSLTVKGLIEERGRLELPGRPLVYGTTHNFLRSLNISSISELPNPPKQQYSEVEDEENKLEDLSAG